MGKSRLAREFVGSLEGATVLGGRCLPYGEGITYWPLAEMVKSAAGISDDDPVKEAMEKLRMCCEDEAVADLLGLAAGVLEAVETDRSGQEIAWAAREWADQLAGVQPLVLVFEDIHWAEEPLFELIEHLATWVRESPLLIVTLARPELLDVRPGWGGGRMRAAAIELFPLRETESVELIEALLPGGTPDAADRQDLLDKTSGNPLFVEETVRMLLESNGDYLPERIPDTLQALIAARIDGLPSAEKALLHRAAVIGRIFWHGAIAHVAPDLDVDGLIDDLLLRDFLLAEPRSTIIGERAYRFKHMLIREVAYAGLSKGDRAELHRRFAEWLKERTGDELLEIRAYHLDHAAQLLAELDGAPPADLAAEAAAALEEAGRRALARESNRSGRKLLLRAVELEPTLERRFQAARAAWRMTELPTVSVEMGKVLEEARAAGDRHTEGKALSALAEVALLRDGDTARATELIDAALEALPAEGRFAALVVQGKIAWTVGDFEVMQQAAEEAVEIAQRLGRKDLEAQALKDVAHVYRKQDRQDEAEAMALARAPARRGERQHRRESAGGVLARQRLPRQARRRPRESRCSTRRASLFTESGDTWNVGLTLNALAWAAEQQGDDAKAERLAARGDPRAQAAPGPRRAVREPARPGGSVDPEGAHRRGGAPGAGGGRDGRPARSLARRRRPTMTLGLVRAAQGRDAEAEALLRESLALIESSGFRGLEGLVRHEAGGVPLGAGP